MPKDSAKTIVCYGDSNTWGRVPKGERYPRSIRWVNILQKLLGDDYEVINEGLNARTFTVIDPMLPERVGLPQLKPLLHTHKPTDLVIVMLGTNDVKHHLNLNAEMITDNLDQTIKVIKELVKDIIVICPPEISPDEDGTLADFFNSQSIETMKELPKLFEKIAKKNNCYFLNSQEHIKPSQIDGYHLDPEAHQKLAELLATQIRKII